MADFAAMCSGGDVCRGDMCSGDVCSGRYCRHTRCCEAVPQLNGVWKESVTIWRGRSATEKPSFADIFSIEYNITIEQQGTFVLVTVPPSLPLRPNPGYLIGVWTQVFTHNGPFWQLTLGDFNDNGSFTFTVKNSRCGLPAQLKGVYVESGYSADNPEQTQAVASITWTRV